MGNDQVHLFQSWREASTKFDYFVAGLLGALVAFIGQSFDPERLGFNPSTLELFALVVLILSFWAAFIRIESNIEMLRLTYERDRSDDELIRLRSARESGDNIRDMTSGEILSKEEQSKIIVTHETKSTAADKHLKTRGTRAYRAYHWRNYLLLAGFLILLAARVLKAYNCAS